MTKNVLLLGCAYPPELPYFTRGVVKTNFLRLAWKDRLRFAGRAVARKLGG